MATSVHQPHTLHTLHTPHTLHTLHTPHISRYDTDLYVLVCGDVMPTCRFATCAYRATYTTSFRFCFFLFLFFYVSRMWRCDALRADLPHVHIEHCPFQATHPHFFFFFFFQNRRGHHRRRRDVYHTQKFGSFHAGVCQGSQSQRLFAGARRI